jgi:hypothetical protein
VNTIEFPSESVLGACIDHLSLNSGCVW